MKKIVILGMLLLSAFFAQSASFQWSGNYLVGPEGSSLVGATAYIYCDILSSDYLSSVNLVADSVAGTNAIPVTAFSVDTAVPDTEYSFYFKVFATYNEKDYFFKSSVVNAISLPLNADGTPAAGSALINFNGDGLALYTATSAQGAWTETVPEPTSGLLLLCGLAGLALRRKRA